MSKLTALGVVPTSMTNPQSDGFYSVWADTDYFLSNESLRDAIAPAINGASVIGQNAPNSSYIATFSLFNASPYRLSWNTSSGFQPGTGRDFIQIMNSRVKRVRVVYGIYPSVSTQLDVEVHINSAPPANWYERSAMSANTNRIFQTGISAPITVASGDIIHIYNFTSWTTFQWGTPFGVWAEEFN